MHRDGREREKDRESRECFIALMLDVFFDHPLQGIKITALEVPTHYHRLAARGPPHAIEVALMRGST